MRILLSNDDGVHSVGLMVLYQELKKMAEVWVVAPLEEKSTTGHSLTIHKPLRMISVRPNFFGVSGSPADCIYLGIQEVLQKKKPDWVVSGINRGANLGQDVYYSGTVSAAREACILGIPSLAVSLAVNFKKRRPESDLHYATAAKMAARIIKTMKNPTLTEHSLLNLNVPDRPLRQVKGLKVVRQGFRFYSGEILRRRDHRGKDYYWVGGQYKGFRNDASTDCFAVESGYAALTPVQLDTTDFHGLATLKEEVDGWNHKKK